MGVITGEDDEGMEGPVTALGLGLMSDEKAVGVPALLQIFETLGVVAPVPDECMEAGVVFHHFEGDFGLEEGIVEIGQMAAGGQRVAHPDAVLRPGGQGHRENEGVEGLGDQGGVLAKGGLESGIEGPYHGSAVLEDFVAGDLGQGVVPQETVDLVGELSFQLGGAGHEPVGVALVGGMDLVAVKQLVEDKVAVGLASEISESNQAAEIGLMAVKVSGHNDLAGRFQFDEVSIAALVVPIGPGSLFEGGDDFLGGHCFELGVGLPPAMR